MKYVFAYFLPLQFDNATSIEETFIMIVVMMYPCRLNLLELLRGCTRHILLSYTSRRHKLQRYASIDILSSFSLVG